MVIDAHTHVGDHVADDGINKLDPTELDLDYATRIEVMDENGIDQAVIMPSYTYEKRHGIENTRALNNRLVELEAEYEQVTRAIGTVEPTHGEAALEELERMAEIGLKGVSWHHRYQGTTIDEPTTKEALRRLDHLGLVAFIHCYDVSEAESIERLANILDCTNQPIIVLDSLTGPLNIQRVIELGREFENLYFDTAMLYPLEFKIETLVERLGAKRVIFGTAFYANPQQYRHSSVLYQIRKASLSDSDREQILEKNIKRLLDI